MTGLPRAIGGSRLGFPGDDSVLLPLMQGRDAAAEAAAGDRKRLPWLYCVEAIASVAASMMTVGIFFYTSHELGWGLRRNFALSAGQGVFYAAGALLAHPLTSRFGWRGPMSGALLAASVLLLLAGIFPAPATIVAALLLGTLLTTLCWPILENLLTAGDIEPREMSRRIAIYNAIWSGIAGLVVAGTGTIIEQFPRGMLLLPAIACGICGVLARVLRLAPPPSEKTETHLEPEPALLIQRGLALRLARISIPAMYIVSYALAPMIPSIPVIRELRPSMQSLLGSIWLIARWVAFLMLGATSFWHARPRLLLLASVGMLVSIVMIILPLSGIYGVDLSVMIAGQLILGAATGLIYTASLYFGMVLSEGSTEHGGYHEALIGAGMAIGPGAGVLTQWLWPGSAVAAVCAVGSLLSATLLLATIVSISYRRR